MAGVLSSGVNASKREAVARLNDLARECGSAETAEGGAGTVSHKAVSVAERIVRALPNGVPMPEFAAEPDGSISLDWIASRTRMLSVSVGIDGDLPYAWLNGPEHGHAVAAFDGHSLPGAVLREIGGIMKPTRLP